MFWEKENECLQVILNLNANIYFLFLSLYIKYDLLYLSDVP